LYAVIQAAMTFPCAVDPEDRSEPVAQVKPAASKLGTPPVPPPDAALEVAEDAAGADDPASEELAAPVPDELAAPVSDELAAPDGEELAAPASDDDALVAGLEVVWDVELLSVPQAARAMAPTASNAASVGNPVILVIFTRLALSGSMSDRIAAHRSEHRDPPRTLSSAGGHAALSG
jgi:hypothetical protein